MYQQFIIPPHWHDADSRTWPMLELDLIYIVYIMGADALATLGARAPATMMLAMLNWTISVPAR